LIKSRLDLWRNEKFMRPIQEAQPLSKISFRVRYCLLVFNDEKMKLNSLLSRNKHMVSLTIDT